MAKLKQIDRGLRFKVQNDYEELMDWYLVISWLRAEEWELSFELRFENWELN